MLHYSETSFCAIYPALKEHIEAYWAEVSALHALEGCHPDLARYAMLEQVQQLFCLVAWTTTQMPVGLFLAILGTHNHLAGLRCAFGDAWYLAPAYRQGRTGLVFLQTALQRLAAREIAHVFLTTTLVHDVDVLYRHLGFIPVERLYYADLRQMKKGRTWPLPPEPQ